MNIDRLVMRTAVVVFLLCVAGTVIAGITSTPQPPQYLIRLADKSYEKGKAAPKTIEECRERAKAIVPGADCVTIEGFANVATCEGVAKPAWPLTLDAEGYVVKPPIRAKQLNDTDWQTEIQDYVPAPYPECWVLGWRVLSDADVAEDASVASVDEPVDIPADVLAAWVASCPIRHERGIVYSDDACT